MKRGVPTFLALALATATLLPVLGASPAFATTRYTDVQYKQFTPVGGGSDWITLDAYVPSSSPPAGGYPTVIAIHGARESGDKNSIQAESNLFAAAGYLVIAPNYRLDCPISNPPPNVDPLLCGFGTDYQVQDLEYLVDTWLPANIGTYQGNINKVGDFGTSSGGNYALLLGTLEDGHTKPVVAASLSGETRLYDYPLSPLASSEGPKDNTYIGCPYGQGDPICDAKWYKASPYDQVSSGDTPSYVSNGAYEIIPMSTATDMGTALTAAGVTNFVRKAPGVAHGSSSEPVVVGPSGTTVMDEAQAFVDTYLMPGSADLALAGTSTPANPSAGAALTYTLTVTDNGPRFGTGVTLTDTLPTGLTFVSATPSQGSCTGTAVVTCSLGAIPSPSSATVTIVGQPTTVKTYVNTPSVSETGPSTDPVSSNNSVTLSNASVAQVNADMQVQLSDSPDPLKAGANLTYTVTAKNNGPDSVNSVSFTDPLPLGATFVSATPSQGSCSTTSGLSTKVTCSLGTLASSGQATTTIVVTPGEPGTATDTVSVSANGVDSVSSNNSATTTTTVQNAAKTTYVSATDTGFSPSAAKSTEGQTVQWTLPTSDVWGHSATEQDGFTTPVFDSGVIEPGQYAAFVFFAAGTYTMLDQVTALTGTVKVGLTVSPSSGGVSTPFTITWANQPAPAGYLYDIQIKRPGGAWTNWHTKYAPGNATFTPDSGTGKYQFRARLRASSGNVVTGYSTASTITVS